MQPLNYYPALLLRRLPLLVAGCVVGAALGWLTTPDDDSSATPATTERYRATHTLVAEGPPESVNLEQLGFLTIVGDVPRTVADRMGVTPSELTARVSVNAMSGIQVLQITAFAEDAQQAVAVADGLADALIGELSRQREARIAELSQRADGLRQERAALTLDPNDVVERQRIDDELAIVLGELRAAEARTVPLSSVESAQSAPISDAAYRGALDFIRTQGSLQAVGGSNANSSGAAQQASTAADSDDDEPSAPLRAAVGAVVGLIAMGALAIALDRLDPRIKSADDAEDALGVPVLAQVPTIERSQRGEQIVVHRQPHSRFAEAFRTLRTAAQSASASHAAAISPSNGHAERGGGSVVLVTSPEPGDGTTTVAVNLAAAFAEAGKRVLVIDADFRKPRAHALLQPKSSATLADALWPASRPATQDPQVSVDFASVISPTSLLGLALLRAADSSSVVINPSRLLVAVRSAAEWATRHFDVVIIDTAALLSVNDASELLSTADTVVLVVRSGSTTREVAAQASELVHRLGASAVGTVLNEAQVSTPARRSDFARAHPAAGAHTATRPREKVAR